MNAPKDKVAVIFKGKAVADLEEIINREKRWDGSDMTYVEAASMAVGKYVAARQTDSHKEQHT